MLFRPARGPATTQRRRIVSIASITAVASLVVAACGGDDDTATTPVETTEAPADTTEAPTETTEAPPDTTEAPTEAPAAAPLVALAESDLGTVVVDSEGYTLYVFDLDVDGAPTCTGECAQFWPPYGAAAGAELTAGDGLDSSRLSIVEHPDGGEMLRYGDWPLYFFADDEAPGDTNGQGINDLWWVLDADGEPVRPEIDDEEAAPADEPLVSLAATDLGEILVAADGRTLYLFSPDADEGGAPTCAGACAGTWPPYLVDDAELTAGDDVDGSLLSVVEHPDGGQMLRYDDWPLYFYGGDQAAGDTNGQGVNSVWWVVDADAQPVTGQSGFSYDN